MVDGDNHMTAHIPQYITSDVATVVNRMRKSRTEIVNTTYFLISVMFCMFLDALFALPPDRVAVQGHIARGNDEMESSILTVLCRLHSSSCNTTLYMVAANVRSDTDNWQPVRIIQLRTEAAARLVRSTIGLNGALSLPSLTIQRHGSATWAMWCRRISPKTTLLFPARL